MSEVSKAQIKDSRKKSKKEIKELKKFIKNRKNNFISGLRSFFKKNRQNKESTENKESKENTTISIIGLVISILAIVFSGLTYIDGKNIREEEQAPNLVLSSLKLNPNSSNCQLPETLENTKDKKEKNGITKIRLPIPSSEDEDKEDEDKKDEDKKIYAYSNLDTEPGQMKFARIPYYSGKVTGDILYDEYGEKFSVVEYETLSIKNMLFINLTQNDCENLEDCENHRSLINFDAFTLQNTGSDLTKIELEKLEIGWINPDSITTINSDGTEIKFDKPTEIIPDKSTNVISTSVAKGNFFTFHASLYYEKDNPPFNMEMLKNGKYIEKKMLLTRGELLNTYFGDEMADLIREWKMTFKLTNKYNEVYKQVVILNVDVDSHTYTTESYKPTLEGKKKFSLLNF
jgi:hypothetical protein